MCMKMRTPQANSSFAWENLQNNKGAIRLNSRSSSWSSTSNSAQRCSPGHREGMRSVREERCIETDSPTHVRTAGSSGERVAHVLRLAVRRVRRLRNAKSYGASSTVAIG